MSAAAPTRPNRAAELTRRVASLPSLPAAVLRLIDVLQAPDSTVDDVVRLLSLDQALSAQVLRLANSPFYGLAGRIASIRDGVNILGLGQIRALVLAAVLTVQFERLHGDALRLQAFWRHGIACAVAAQRLARHADLNEGAAFTAGLLHDLGRLVLDSQYPDDMRELQLLADQQDLPAYLLEQRHFGVSHTELGSELARRWHFSPDICEAIARHHEPALVGPVTLTDAVHLGNAIAHALDVAGLPHEVVPNIRSAVWGRLRLDDQCLPELLRDTEQKYLELQVVLKPETESRP